MNKKRKAAYKAIDVVFSKGFYKDSIDLDLQSAQKIYEFLVERSGIDQIVIRGKDYIPFELDKDQE